MRVRVMSGLVVLLLVIPGICFAAVDFDFDLRVKLGTAAGADKITFEPYPDYLSGSGDASGNFQIEFNFIPLAGSIVSPVVGVGLFSRKHSGTLHDPFLEIPPTKVDYKVSGLTFGAGVRIRANQNLHFEGRVELAGGRGEPTLSTPGWVWNPVREAGYGSSSLIVGGYYTLTEPGLQLGLEIGAQSFRGDFEIWNDDGFWTTPEVEGGGGTVNLLVGFRF